MLMEKKKIGQGGRGDSISTSLSGMRKPVWIPGAVYLIEEFRLSSYKLVRDNRQKKYYIFL